MNVKKALIIIVLLMAVVVCSVFSTSKLVSAIGDDGFAVPTSTDPIKFIRAEKEAPIGLVQVDRDDEIFANIAGYYLGKDHTLVNRTYPLYTNNGGSLTFLDDEKWLVTDDVILLQSFNGMFLSDGVTYAADRTRADEDNFILVSLSNGLYMNARAAAFINVNGEHEIPVNSIIQFTDTDIRWMYYKDGALFYDHESSVFGATIRIGENEYDYAAFVEALGLVSEAIGEIEKGNDPEEILEEANEILHKKSQKQAAIFNSSYKRIVSDDADKDNQRTDIDIDRSGEGADKEGKSGNDNNNESQEVPGAAGGEGAAGGQSGSESGAHESNPSEHKGGKEGSGGEGDSTTSSAIKTDSEGDVLEEDDPEWTDAGKTAEDWEYEEDENHTVPVVELSDLQAWTYAVSGKLKIRDPGYNIIKGVKVNVYNSIDTADRNAKPTKTVVTDADGNKTEIQVYPAVNDEGATAYYCSNLLQRKTFFSSKNAVLSPIEPESTVYVQLNYKYYAYTEEMVENEEGEFEKITKVSRVNYNSPIYELRTLPISGNISGITYDWTEEFAVASNAFKISDIVLKDVSEAAQEETSPAAVQSVADIVNSALQYVSKIEFKLKPELGDGTSEAVAYVKSAIIDDAIGGNAPEFTSSKILAPNTKYSYEVSFYDRFGNKIEASPASGSKITNIIYTSYAMPKVNIELVSATPGKTELKITVADEKNRLTSEGGQKKPLELKIFDSKNAAAIIDGEFSEGVRIADGDGTVLLLSGKDEYTVTVTSLDYNRYYTARVYGEYNLQPSVTDGSMHPLENVYGELASFRALTSPFISGTVIINGAYTNITSSNAKLQFTVNSGSKVGSDEKISEVADCIRYTLSSTKSGVKEKVIELSRKDLMILVTDFGQYVYNEKVGGVIFRNADEAKGIPGITFLGNREDFQDKYLWEVLFPDTNEQGVANKPVTTVFDLPSGYLSSAAPYKVTGKTLSIRMGEEYEISTRVVPSDLNTLKKRATVDMEEIVASGISLELVDFVVNDPDEAIEGSVTAYVYAGDTIIASKTITNFRNRQNVKFEKLGISSSYMVSVVASSYSENISSGRADSNVEIWRSEEIAAGKSISGDLTLSSLEYSSSKEGKVLFKFSGDEITAAGSGWTVSGSTCVYTYSNIPEDADYLRVNLLEINKYSNSNTVKADYYNAAGTSLGSQSIKLSLNNAPVFTLPDGAVKVKFTLPVEYKNGAEVDYFTSADNRQAVEEKLGITWNKGTRFNVENGTFSANTNYKVLQYIPVKSGERYVVSSKGNNSWVACYSADKSFVYTYAFGTKVDLTDNNSMSDKELIIGQGVSYICIMTGIDTDNLHLFKLLDCSSATAYKVNYDLDINDFGGYLVKENDKHEKYSEAKVTLYRSVDKKNINYTTFEAISAALHEEEYPGAEEGDLPVIVWKNDKTAWTIDGLAANCAWKLSLTADYRGSVVELDSIEFTTEETYYLIHNARDLTQIRNNPYGNYLVVEDFDYDDSIFYVNSEWLMNFKFYGTIDFQGHSVTKSTASTRVDALFYNNYGTIKNAVFVLPDGTVNRSPFIDTNRGKIENCIIKTTGIVTQNTIERTVNGNYDGAPAFIRHNYGLVDGFIFYLGDDWTCYTAKTSGSTAVDIHQAVFVAMNHSGGVIQNGYVCGSGTAGINTTSHDEFIGTQYEALFYKNERGGVIRNIFSTVNLYCNAKKGSAYRVMFALYNTGTMENLYWTGEAYDKYEGNDKDGMVISDTDRTLNRNISSKTVSNIMHLTGKNRQGNALISYVPVSNYSLLRNSSWQEGMLGNSFEIDSYLDVGLYPRLKLPAAVDAYQPYLRLPDVVITNNTPILVSDAWAPADGTYDHNETSGVFTLTFKNNLNLPISDIEVPGLVNYDNGKTTIPVFYSEALADSYTRVYVKVKATEFYSSYNVASFHYVYGGVVQTGTPSDYWTGGIEFWKGIEDVQDWYAIKDHLDWNYHILRNIAFGDISNAEAIKIKGTFTGQIDGSYYEDGVLQCRTLTGINMNGVAEPWVIETLGDTNSSLRYPASVRNLIVNGMNLTAASNATCSYTGFIRNAKNCSISNIHIQNSSIMSRSNIGMLVACIGQMPVEISDCSVINSSIKDIKTTSKIVVGGLVGTISIPSGMTVADCHASISNCFALNLSIDIDRSTDLQGAGGIAGNFSGSINNCYSTGHIYAVGNYLGGIIGTSQGEPTANATVTNCWTSMTVKATGIYTGGVAGGGSAVYKSLSAGNILASSERYAHRVKGLAAVPSLATKNFAYRSQMVSKTTGTPLGSDDRDDAYGLVSAEDMATKSFWMNDLEFNALYWDMDSVGRNAYPKLLSADGSGRLIYGQTGDIMLPSLANDLSVEVSSASYSGGKYYATLNLKNSKQTAARLAEMFESRALELDIYGMPAEYTNYSFHSTLDDDVIEIDVVSEGFEKAFDAYVFTATFNNEQKSVSIAINYGEPVYWEISTLTEWQTAMMSHSNTGENFRINGMINFEGADAGTRTLQIGRLVGKSGVESGFMNMNYIGGTAAEPWISTIGTELGGITFKNMNIDYSKGNSRSATGFISNANYVHDCAFENVNTLVRRQTAAHSGFFSTVFTYIEGIEINGMSYKSADPSGTAYVTLQGTLAAEVYDHISNVTASGIDMDVYYGYQTGGIIGYISDKNGTNETSHDVTLMKSTVSAFTDMGGVAYNIHSFRNGLVDESAIIANRTMSNSTNAYLGGFAARFTNAYTTDNVTVSNSIIKTAAKNMQGYTGGIAGYMYDTHVASNLLSLNNTVSGNTYVGGLIANSYRGTVRNCQVVGTTVKLENYDISYNGDSSGFGGAFGITENTMNGITVRDCDISGPNRVGGLIGAGTTGTVNSAMIAEDVKVSGYAYVGGAVGAGNTIMSHVACGATVSGVTNVGGLFGYAYTTNGNGRNYLSSSYYQGNIVAIENPGYKFTVPAISRTRDFTPGEYFGGLVGRVLQYNTTYSYPATGKVTTETYYFTTANNFNKVVFAGNIDTSGISGDHKHVSLVFNHYNPYEMIVLGTYDGHDLFTVTDTQKYAWNSKTADFQSNIRIYEGSKLNGAYAAGLFTTQSAVVSHDVSGEDLVWVNNKHENIPAGASLVTYNQLANPAWWGTSTGLTFPSTNWDLSNMYNWTNNAYGSNTANVIPDAYTATAVLASNDYNWIATGLNPAIYSKISLETSMNWLTAEFTGSRNNVIGTTANQFKFTFRNGSYYLNGTSVNTGLTHDKNTAITVKYTSEIADKQNKQTLRVGNREYVYNYPSVNMPNKEIFLFAADKTSSSYARVAMSTVNFYLDDKLAAVFVPCIRNLDGRAGFYVYKYENGATKESFMPLHMWYVSGITNEVNASNEFMPYPCYDYNEMRYSRFDSYDEMGNPDGDYVGIHLPVKYTAPVNAAAPVKSAAPAKMTLKSMVSSYVNKLQSDSTAPDTVTEENIPDVDELGSIAEEVSEATPIEAPKEADIVNKDLAAVLIAEASGFGAEKTSDEVTVEIRPETEKYEKLVRAGLSKIFASEHSDEELVDMGIIPLATLVETAPVESEADGISLADGSNTESGINLISGSNTESGEELNETPVQEVPAVVEKQAADLFLVNGIGIVNKEGEVLETVESIVVEDNSIVSTEEVLVASVEDVDLQDALNNGKQKGIKIAYSDLQALYKPAAEENVIDITRLVNDSNSSRNVTDADTKGYTLIVLTSVSAVLILALVFLIIRSRKQQGNQ